MTTIESLEDEPRVTRRNRAEVRRDGASVVYWMQRAQRARDNPALDLAIRAANLLEKPVVVLLSLALGPRVGLRHHRFVVEGLPALAEELAARRVGFVLRDAEQAVDAFAREVGACLVVGDENPLRDAEAVRERAGARLSVPFWTVDADVVVPSRLIGREHWAARTIRPRIHEQLERFLVAERAPRPRVPWGGAVARRVPSLDPRAPLGEPARRSGVEPRGGVDRAQERLRRFVRDGLPGYARRRNRPEVEGTSRLSPYLRFGMIGPREVALAAKGADAPREDRDAFLEELIVRRELAVNFVRYNPAYDRLDGCERWARATLAKHARDPRRLVPARLLAAAESPDPLWNAAQAQALETGWMHGYLRMYWAKRLLEWTRSPEEAFALAVTMNDALELDGGDPNGYAGVAWAIGGKHDRAFAERPIYGKVRFMSPTALARRFDAAAYIRAYAPMGTAGYADQFQSLV